MPLFREKMSKEEDVSVNDLLQELNDTEEFGDLKKAASKVPTPLLETSQAAQARANRHAAFEEIKKENEKWSAIAREQDAQRTITFGEPKMSAKSKKFHPIKSELAETINSILDEQKLTPEAQEKLEDEVNSKLTEKELKERALRLASLRRLQFYNEEKARRWKKIKSKAFRRLHKRDMAPIPLEELAEVDPEKFQKELEKVEAKRAKERITLRHKNTSQWVRRVLARGLKSASDELKESYEKQLKLGEELMKKVNIKKSLEGDDEEEDEEEEEIKDEVKAEGEKFEGLLNMKFMKEAAQKKENEIEELKKMLAEDDSKETKSTGIVTIARKAKGEKPKGKVVNADGDDYVEDEVDEKAKKEIAEENGEVLDKQPEEKASKETEEIQEPPAAEAPVVEKQEPKKISPFQRKQNRIQRKTVDAKQFFLEQPTENELNQIADGINFKKNEENEEVLNEMFGHNDEFDREKEELAIKEASASLPSMDEMHLEGWGSWTGPGVKPNARAERRKKQLEKERQKIIEDAKKNRKDANLEGVILSEEALKTVDRYAITDVPHAYSNPRQLKAQMSYPIGPEFNTVSGYQQLIKPDMITKAGAPIEPIFMSKMNKRKERIVRMKNQRKSLDQDKTLK